MRQTGDRRKDLVRSSMFSTCLLLPEVVASTHLALAQVVKGTIRDSAGTTDPGSYGAGLQKVNQDEIAEMKVQTSNFGAEKLRGPIIITTVTRSGSEHSHGELCTYARTSRLDSSVALNGPTNQAKDATQTLFHLQARRPQMSSGSRTALTSCRMGAEQRG